MVIGIGIYGRNNWGFPGISYVDRYSALPIIKIQGNFRFLHRIDVSGKFLKISIGPIDLQVIGALVRPQLPVVRERLPRLYRIASRNAISMVQVVTMVYHAGIALVPNGPIDLVFIFRLP